MKKITISNILLVLCLIGLNSNLSAQQIHYFDDYYGQFATCDSRVVTTIKEFEDSDEVHIEALLVGELNVGIFQINLHYDPEVVVPVKGPGGEEMTSNLNGPGTALGDYFWLNPDLPNVNTWRSSSSGQVNPQSSAPWTFIMTGGNEGLGTNLVLEDGNIMQIFKIFFKKLPGKTLSNNTFSYYDKLTVPQVRNLFARGLTYIYMSGAVNNVTSFLNSNVFSLRIPSSVRTGEPEVKGTSVTLNGIATSEGLSKIPTIPDVSGGLDWDTIITSGFIYTKSDILLTIDDYSKKIKIDNIEYDFPSVTSGSFMLGTVPFFIESEININKASRIEMNYQLTNLDSEEDYFVYAFMKYKFQTSDEYPLLGDRTGFKTGKACENETPLVTSPVQNNMLNSGELFNYTITTSIPVDEITWTRMAHPDINNNESSSGNSAIINEILYSTGAQTVTVTYLITARIDDCVFENIGEIYVTVVPEINMSVNSLIVTCNNDYATQIAYQINIEGASYKLIFSPESVVAGFISITDYMALPESNIQITLPLGLPAGNYAATLYVKYVNWEETFAIEIIVNALPELTAASETEIFLMENEELYLFVEVAGDAEYQWFFEGNIIYGATESCFTELVDATNVGTYSVSISNECGSLLHFFHVKMQGNSVNENLTKGNRLSVYPNPVSKNEKVTLLLELADPTNLNAVAQIFDMSGKKVDEFKINGCKTEISLNYQTGVYLVRVQSMNRYLLSSKIIIR